MLILAHLTARPAHGVESKTHVERTLGGSSAIDNTLPYPTLQREAVLRNHLAHVAAVCLATLQQRSVTTELDPHVLLPEYAVALYNRRWRIMVQGPQ